MIAATSSLLQQVMGQQATADSLSALSVACGGQALVLQVRVEWCISIAPCT